MQIEFTSNPYFTQLQLESQEQPSQLAQVELVQPPKTFVQVQLDSAFVHAPSAIDVISRELPNVARKNPIATSNPPTAFLVVIIAIST